MEFYQKYISQTTKDEITLSPTIDKEGKIIPETRIVLADRDFAIVEALNNIAEAIRNKR